MLYHLLPMGESPEEVLSEIRKNWSGPVIYLVYAEFIIIGSICLYCTSVHVITFLLFVLTAFGAAIWGTKPGVAWMRARKTDPEAAVSA